RPPRVERTSSSAISRGSPACSRSCSSRTRSSSTACWRRLPHMALASLHHVTCVCADAQRTAAFYRDELGFSLVKKTVNFDDPHSYHLYSGDEDASPASLLTFFEWPRADRGRLGRGTCESVGLLSPIVQTNWQ